MLFRSEGEEAAEGESVSSENPDLTESLTPAELSEKVIPDARFREDLEADSLDLVELIMAFEEEFGGEISDDDAQKITTVGEAVIYVEQQMTKS